MENHKENIIESFNSDVLANMFILALQSNPDKLTYSKDNTTFEKDYSIYEFIVNMFLDELKIVLLRKPYKTYVEVEDNLHFLKGKINLKKTILNVDYKVNCTFDELTLNNKLNIIIKYILYLLLTNKETKKNYQTIKRIHEMYEFLEEVPFKEITIKDIDNINLNKENNNYKTLLLISKYILGCIKDESNTLEKHIDIESKLWWIFQEFIRNYFNSKKKILKINTVSSSSNKWNLTPLNGANIKLLPNMRTDIEIDTDNQHIIIDAKCYEYSLTKFFGKEMFHPSHLYQLKSYLDNYKNIDNKEIRGILIYPYNHKNNFHIGHQRFIDKETMYTIEVVDIDFKVSWDEVCNQLDKLLEFGDEFL